MPAVLPPGGSGGLPSISIRALQLLDLGYSVWDAFRIALNEWVQAVVAYYGNEAAVTLSRIGE